jgi:sugar phosphate isomerase/epimerase
MVDWDLFFSRIAKARFTGPLSLHVEYDPEDEHAAIAGDLAFMKKMVEKHYG